MSFTQSDLIVPRPLFGAGPEVRRIWRSVTTRALRDKTWKHVLEDMEFVSLKECPEDMVMNMYGAYQSYGESWQLLVVHGLLIGREDRCCLNWDGLKYPWFVLSALCSQGAGHPALEDERRRFAIHALPIVLQWWDCYCSMDQRFIAGPGSQFRGWPRWNGFIKTLFQYLDVPDEKGIQLGRMPPEEAKEMILKWIDDGEIAGIKKPE